LIVAFSDIVLFVDFAVAVVVVSVADFVGRVRELAHILASVFVFAVHIEEAVIALISVEYALAVFTLGPLCSVWKAAHFTAFAAVERVVVKVEVLVGLSVTVIVPAVAGRIVVLLFKTFVFATVGRISIQVDIADIAFRHSAYALRAFHYRPFQLAGVVATTAVSRVDV